MLSPPADSRLLVGTFVLLQRRHDEIPADWFTRGWLIHSLH